MQQYQLRKGLDVPVTGAPEQTIVDGPEIQTVAILGDDYIGLKPRLAVQEGDAIGAGAPVLAHKDTPDAIVTSPVSGRVKAINRGARRKLISVEIEVDPTAAEPVDFSKVGDATSAEGMTEKLCKSGLWGAFRTRPYSKVPEPGTKPLAIFVTAMDTEPLSADADVIINDAADAFKTGLEAIAKLTDGATWLCHETGKSVPGGDVADVSVATFSGPHPAGLAGTHIHFLEPVNAAKTVWTIGYHDVIAIGRLLETGTLDASRVIAIGGSLAKNPRLVRTITGASLTELAGADVPEGDPVRMVSGSILSGRAGEGPSAYLGRYARQVTVMKEDRDPIFLGWIRPMFSKFSAQPVLGSAFTQMFSKKTFPMGSNLNGSRRAMVPTGLFETLMPQDYLPTQLLRSLLVMDTDQAQALGVMELDEEDLGLVGFACPAKYEYGMALRASLAKIEVEG